MRPFNTVIYIKMEQVTDVLKRSDLTPEQMFVEVVLRAIVKQNDQEELKRVDRLTKSRALLILDGFDELKGEIFSQEFLIKTDLQTLLPRQQQLL